MRTLLHATLAALALLGMVSAASATFIKLPGLGGIDTDKIFDDIDRRAP